MAEEGRDKIRPAREEGTGTARDESTATLLNNQQESWFANGKLAYDNTLVRLFDSIGRDRLAFDGVMSVERQRLADLHARALNSLDLVQRLAEKAGTNSAEIDKASSDQRIRHADVAIDAQWNPVQQGAADTMTVKAVQLDDASVKAIAAAIAIAINNNK